MIALGNLVKYDKNYDGYGNFLPYFNVGAQLFGSAANVYAAKYQAKTQKEIAEKQAKVMKHQADVQYNIASLQYNLETQKLMEQAREFDKQYELSQKQLELLKDQLNKQYVLQRMQLAKQYESGQLTKQAYLEALAHLEDNYNQKLAAIYSYMDRKSSIIDNNIIPLILTAIALGGFYLITVKHS